MKMGQTSSSGSSGCSPVFGGTPLYYADALKRWPKRHAQVVRAFADAPEGAVLVHCARGHDRTGIAVLLLLRLAGVSPEHIAEDYIKSD